MEHAVSRISDQVSSESQKPIASPPSSHRTCSPLQAQSQASDPAGLAIAPDLPSSFRSSTKKPKSKSSSSSPVLATDSSISYPKTIRSDASACSSDFSFNTESCPKFSSCSSAANHLSGSSWPGSQQAEKVVAIAAHERPLDRAGVESEDQVELIDSDRVARAREREEKSARDRKLIHGDSLASGLSTSLASLNTSSLGSGIVSLSSQQDQHLPRAPILPRPPLEGRASYHSSTTTSISRENERTAFIALKCNHHRTESYYSSASSGSTSRYVAQNKRISFPRDVRNGNSPAPQLMLPPRLNKAMQEGLETQKKQREERENLKVTNGGGRGGTGRRKLGFGFRRPKTAPATTDASTSSVLSSASSSQSQEVESSLQSPTPTEEKSLPRLPALDRQASEASFSGSEPQELLQSAQISRANSSNTEADELVSFCGSSAVGSGPASQPTRPVSAYSASPLSVSPLTKSAELPSSDHDLSRTGQPAKELRCSNFNLEKVTALLESRECDQVPGSSINSSMKTSDQSATSRRDLSRRPASAGAETEVRFGQRQDSTFRNPQFTKGGWTRVESDASSGDVSLRSLPAQLTLQAAVQKPFDDDRISHTRLETLPPPPRAFYPGTLILVRDRKSSDSESEQTSTASPACSDRDHSDLDAASEDGKSTEDMSQQMQVSKPLNASINHLTSPSDFNDVNSRSSSTVDSPITVMTSRGGSTSDRGDAGSTTSMDSNLLVDTPPIDHQVQFAELVPTTSHPRSPGGRKILWDNEHVKLIPTLNAAPPSIPKREKAVIPQQDTLNQGAPPARMDPTGRKQEEKADQMSATKRFKKVGKAVRAVVRMLAGSGSGMESEKRAEVKSRKKPKTSEVEEKLYDDDGNVKSWSGMGLEETKDDRERSKSFSHQASSSTKNTISKAAHPQASDFPSPRGFIEKSRSLTKSMRSRASRVLNDKYERTPSMRIVSSRDLGRVNSILLSPRSSVQGECHVKAKSSAYDDFGALRLENPNQLRPKTADAATEEDQPNLTLSLPSSAHSGSFGHKLSTAVTNGGASHSPSIFAHSPNLPRPTAFDLPPPSQQNRSGNTGTSTSRPGSRRGSAQSSRAGNPTTSKNQSRGVSKDEHELKREATMDSKRESHDVHGGAEHYL